jgi:mxaC protein
MNVGVDHAWLLTLLLVAALPLLRSPHRRTPIGSVVVVPADRLSGVLRPTLRSAGMVAIALIVTALAGPYYGGRTVSRIGTGAQVVILLDRSGSMNDTFAGRTPAGTEESKASATKRLLRDFIGRRPHDLFGVAAFSTSPILVLPLTDHQDAVLAAVNASDRRGLDFTNIGRGLGMALSMFAADRPDEHHVILLVSDGGAVIDHRVQDQLRAAFTRYRADLYFLFLRTAGSKGLFDTPNPGENTPQAMPERFLHLYFETLGIPYHAFQAENPQQVENAIRQIDALERCPIVYTERLPRRDLTDWAYALAILPILVLLAAKLVEARITPMPTETAAPSQWRRAA